MRDTKSPALVIAAVFIQAVCICVQSGCTAPGNVDELSRHTEPLHVRKAGGRIESITFAQAMAFHHAHEHHADAVTSATVAESSRPDRHDTKRHDELCAGIAVGYQAIRYAATRLFPGEIPNASDFDLSVAGSMRGAWDILNLYTGKKLAPSKAQQKKMSLESFTFVARRVSAGQTLTFRLRAGLIPPEFFRLKNQGASCDDPALETLKKQSVQKILSLQPAECFERLAP